MPWNHRVVKRLTSDPDEPWEYSVREVFFDSIIDGEYVNMGMTVDPIPALGDSEDSLKYWLEMMLKALDKPTLTDDAPNEESYRTHTRRLLDTHRLMDAAESLSAIIHELESRGAEITDDEDAQWSRVTDVIQEMRGVYGLEAPKTRGNPNVAGY